MFFSVTTKNLNWEILTKNLVTFKYENFSIMGVHWKIQFLGGGFTKNQYIGGIAWKGGGGAWTVCRFKGEGVGKGEGGLWVRVVNNLMHTMFRFEKFV